MEKTVLTLLCLLFLSQNSFSQGVTKDFEIILPKNKVENSLYNKIGYINSMHGDTSMIGIVDIGVLKNIEAKLILKTPLQGQLNTVLNALTDSTAQNGELLFQLQRFHFAETYGTRYCYLTAGLYAKMDAGYKKLALIDTVLLFRSANSNFLIGEESKLITGFIAQNLLRQPVGTTVYTLNDVARIDSIEMLELPLYNAAIYKDGLYNTYKSFASQMPDKQPIVETDRDGNISTVNP